MESAETVQLIATSAPGRASRKARAFGPEIVRLRRDGYTFEAIRELLANAGLTVSKSTVHREAARQSMKRLPATPIHSGTAVPVAITSHVRPVVSTSGPGEATRRGPEIAEAFMKDQITNPLMLRRMRDEDSSH